MSFVDRTYRKLLYSNVFVKGWGDPSFIQRIIENHKEVSKRERCRHIVKTFDIKLVNTEVNNKTTVVEGSFISPFSDLLPGSMCQNNRLARFKLIIPNQWRSKYKPLCIHYAGTGDQDFSRRKFVLGDPLIKDGIASLIHMNPFYGTRKPVDQRGSSLNYLFDLFVMGGALILEAQVLLRWAIKQGFGPLAIHGVSMGGHMACLGASVYPEPVCLIPCLSWTTASHVFTEGAMSPAVAWDVLTQQYYSNDVFSRSIRSAIEPPVPYHLQMTDKRLIALDSLVLPAKVPKIIDNTTVRHQEPLATIIRNAGLLNLNNSNRNNVSKTEVVQFMRDILDYFTHLGNYSIPMDTRLVTAVVAEKDAYIPIDGVAHFNEVWDSLCEVEILKGRGHVGAYVQNSFSRNDKFREAIVRTLNRYVELYHNEPGPFGLKK